jgi:hypothetical protein
LTWWFVRRRHNTSATGRRRLNLGRCRRPERYNDNDFSYGTVEYGCIQRDFKCDRTEYGMNDGRDERWSELTQLNQ